MKDNELKIKTIKDGTVIDHLPVSTALKVFEMLGLELHTPTITIGISVPSSKTGAKDILKIENRELSKEESDKIALISPNATINIIKDFEVIKKNKVEIPEKVVNLMKCSNPNCISNHEPADSIFYLINKDNISLICHYCERTSEVNPKNLNV